MFIITAVGADRPGMAHAVTQVLADSGYNIEDTTMTRLSGEFAMILIVSPPSASQSHDLLSHLTPLKKSHGLFINCHEIPAETVRQTEETADRYILSIYGPENKGLVARITGVVAAHNVNISDVQTRVASAGALYVMVYELEAIASVNIAAFTADLEEAAHSIGAQISLRPLEEDTL